MRGICIFIMVGSVLLSMFGDTFKAIAGLYGHGASGWQVVAGNAHFVNGGYSGIAFADVFAPLFIFVIGLTFCSSFKRREQMYGATRACFQLGVRFAALTGFGAVVDGVSCPICSAESGTKCSLPTNFSAWLPLCSLPRFWFFL